VKAPVENGPASTSNNTNTANTANNDIASLELPARREIDFSEYKSFLNEDPIDYIKMGVPYAGLLDKEEARSKLASEEARRDAGSNALIQLGAGIAAGDLSKGLSKAGEVAMLGKKDARAEDRSLSALKRQIELADRTQKSALEIKTAEKGRERKNELIQFGLKVQQEAINSDDKTRDAYLKMQTLEQAMREAPTGEEREAALEYKRSQTAYYKAFAESKAYASSVPQAALNAEIAKAQSDAVLSQEIMGLSTKEAEEWARRRILAIGGGATPNMSNASGEAVSFNQLPLGG